MKTCPLVIYHADCADGFGAAFAAWLKLGDEVQYQPMHYGKTIQEYQGPLTVADREIYILDFSFPKQVMDELFQYAKRVVWLDHHKTAFEMWCEKYEKGMRYAVGDTLLDDNKSGAYLAWEFFHPDTEIPMLIRHIDDYDRWQFKLKGTKEINKALWSFAPWSFQQWQEIVDDDQYGSMWSQGAAILRAHEQNVQSVVKGSARECSIVPAVINSVDSYNPPWVWWNDANFGNTCGVNGLSANCPPFLTSDVGHELANQSGTFGLCWTLSQEGLIAKCSLRSNGEYDVSAIAKVFGGGGHRNAAGFQVPIETLLEWLK